MDEIMRDNAIENQKAIKPVFSNTFRVAYSETEFFVDYGFIIPEEKEMDDTAVNVLSKIVIPAERFSTLILSLFRAAVDYEKQFDKDIGFGTNNEKSQTEE